MHAKIEFVLILIIYYIIVYNQICAASASVLFSTLVKQIVTYVLGYINITYIGYIVLGCINLLLALSKNANSFNNCLEDINAVVNIKV